jgi:uncharacterized protein
MESTTASSAIATKIWATPFIDTHEHLIEESRRIAGPRPGDSFLPCDDWAYLFHHYAQDDLAVAGMGTETLSRFFSIEFSPQEKWALFAPYWPRIRHTGYGRAVLLTVQRLFNVEDIRADTVEQITRQMRGNVRKGFYQHIIQECANLKFCQVQSLEYTFCKTEYPELLYQDINTVPLSSGLDVPRLRRESGLPITTLQGCHDAIHWYFEQYGQQAVAIKNSSAYSRRLDYADISAAKAEPLFARYIAHENALSPAELKALQDHLWRYCVEQATAYQLPVKLHTGYYAGSRRMPLARVSMNLPDLCNVLQDFPETNFVLMHIAYPYQDEMIAIAKQYPNVYVDLCWSWIINPLATIRFVKEFLAAVPSNKLLTFGGDYYSIEPIVGHAEIARYGLSQALSQLVTEGWTTEEEVVELIEPLMWGNAWSLFRMEEKQAVAKQLMIER